MKGNLNSEDRTAMASYRMKRAKETLREADVMINDGFYNAAINRLYYACYYALTGLLVQRGIAAQTHQGVRQMFGLHFIVPGLVANKYAQFYSQLFNARISGDYDDFLQYDADILAEMRPKAEEFIEAIEREMNK